MITYMAIDPGKTTGYAFFDEHGDVKEIGRISGDNEFLDFLESLSEFPRVFIIERYRNRPREFGGGNTWSVGPTQQLIGGIKRTLHKRQISQSDIHYQEPSILPIACKWAGIPYSKKKHLPDDQSAFVHGVYWLIKNKVRKHRLAKK